MALPLQSGTPAREVWAEEVIWWTRTSYKRAWMPFAEGRSTLPKSTDSAIDDDHYVFLAVERVQPYLFVFIFDT